MAGGGTRARVCAVDRSAGLPTIHAASASARSHAMARRGIFPRREQRAGRLRPRSIRGGRHRWRPMRRRFSADRRTVCRLAGSRCRRPRARAGDRAADGAADRLFTGGRPHRRHRRLSRGPARAAGLPDLSTSGQPRHASVDPGGDRHDLDRRRARRRRRRHPRDPRSRVCVGQLAARQGVPGDRTARPPFGGNVAVRMSFRLSR